MPFRFCPEYTKRRDSAVSCKTCPKLSRISILLTREDTYLCRLTNVSILARQDKRNIEIGPLDRSVASHCSRNGEHRACCARREIKLNLIKDRPWPHTVRPAACRARFTWMIVHEWAPLTIINQAYVPRLVSWYTRKLISVRPMSIIYSAAIFTRLSDFNLQFNSSWIPIAFVANIPKDGRTMFRLLNKVGIKLRR